MNNPKCPKTGALMDRGVHPMTLTYENKSITFDMPGWYCNDCNEGIHTGKDMEVSDLVLEKLKNE